MKIQVASDLHLEHIQDNPNEVDFQDVIIPAADVLTLAGDISTYDCPLLVPGVVTIFDKSCGFRVIMNTTLKGSVLLKSLTNPILLSARSLAMSIT